MYNQYYYNILNFRDKTEQTKIYTTTIQKAIDHCHKEGGGTVYVPPGDYQIGSILLKDNVTLYVESGATLIGSTDISDYTSGHLIYAKDAKNVGIEGKGCIDGQGASFWVDKELDEDVLWRKGWGEVSHYYKRCLKRPERLVRFVGCQNVHVTDILLKNSANWTLHFLCCNEVSVHKIRIHNPLEGPNTDGIDIDSSQNVSISDCKICTGDDAIVLKNTNLEGRKQTTRNIAVTNCTLTTPCNAFKIGTESQSDFENISFSNSNIYSAEDWEIYDKAISGISIEMVDGSKLSQVNISNITIMNARSPIFIRLGNRGRGQKVATPGRLSDVKISQIQARGAILPCIISGIEEAFMERIYLTDIHLSFIGAGEEAQIPAVVPDIPSDYPEAVMFGRWLPVYGLFCRHVKGLFLRNIDLWLEGEDKREAIQITQVSDLHKNQISVNGVLIE